MYTYIYVCGYPSVIVVTWQALPEVDEKVDVTRVWEMLEMIRILYPRGTKYLFRIRHMKVHTIHESTSNSFLE